MSNHQATPPVNECQYAKDVGMPEYRCAVQCQYATPPAAPAATEGEPAGKCERCAGRGTEGDHNGERYVEVACDRCHGTGRDYSMPPAAPAATEAPSEPVTAEEIDKKVREVYIGEGPRGLMMLCKRLMGASVQPVLASLSDAIDGPRYRLLRRGQHWSVIDGIGNTLRAESLDTAVDAALASSTPTKGGAS